jgi:hypothetical protein
MFIVITTVARPSWRTWSAIPDAPARELPSIVVTISSLVILNLIQDPPRSVLTRTAVVLYSVPPMSCWTCFSISRFQRAIVYHHPEPSTSSFCWWSVPQVALAISHTGMSIPRHPELDSGFPDVVCYWCLLKSCRYLGTRYACPSVIPVLAPWSLPRRLDRVLPSASKWYVHSLLLCGGVYPEPHDGVVLFCDEYFVCMFIDSNDVESCWKCYLCSFACLDCCNLDECSGYGVYVCVSIAVRF